MKLRWMILGLAGLAVALSWGAAAFAYFFLNPSIGLWTVLVSAAALSLEVFFWVAAGVVGWSFLAGRRQMLAKLQRRFHRE